MLRSTIRMIIPSENHRDALEILASVSEQTQFEPGCVCSRLYRDVTDSRVMLLEELWLSFEDLQCHMQSERYHHILLVVEMAAQPPEIRFDTIAQTSGMETIEQARNVRTGRGQGLTDRQRNRTRPRKTIPGAGLDQLKRRR